MVAAALGQAPPAARPGRCRSGLTAGRRSAPFPPSLAYWPASLQESDDRPAGRSWPKLASLMDESEHDVLACLTFPASTGPSMARRPWIRFLQEPGPGGPAGPHRTNLLEWLNKEVKRRADLVGIFPGEPAVIRLIGAVLLEQNDEWQTSHRQMQLEAMAEPMAPTPDAEPAQIPPQGRLNDDHPRSTPTYTSLMDTTTAVQERGDAPIAVRRPLVDKLADQRHESVVLSCPPNSLSGELLGGLPKA